MSSPLCVFSACAWFLNLCFFSASEPYKRLVFWISFDGQGPCLLSRPFVLCQQGLRDSGTASFHECPPPHVFHAWLCLLSRPFVLCQQRFCATNQMSSHVKSCLSSTRFSSLKLISYFSAFHLALAVLTCLHKFLQRIHRSLESFEKILKRSWRESERFKCCSKVSERLQRSSWEVFERSQ